MGRMLLASCKQEKSEWSLREIKERDGHWKTAEKGHSVGQPVLD